MPEILPAQPQFFVAFFLRSGRLCQKTALGLRQRGRFALTGFQIFVERLSKRLRGDVRQINLDFLFDHFMTRYEIHFFRIIHVIEVAKLLAKEFRGKKTGEQTFRFFHHGIQREMVTQNEVQIQVVLPFRPTAQGISARYAMLSLCRRPGNIPCADFA